MFKLPRRRPRHRRKPRRGLRCLMGSHGDTWTVYYRDENSPWATELSYCTRCRFVLECDAKHVTSNK